MIRFVMNMDVKEIERRTEEKSHTYLITNVVYILNVRVLYTHGDSHAHYNQ